MGEFLKKVPVAVEARIVRDWSGTASNAMG
jgi:hypothetical protein